MTVPDAIFLGILQGLTEFLPVSSSGHLVILQSILTVRQPGLAFEVWVHFGTLLAVVFAFRRQIGELTRAAAGAAARAVGRWPADGPGSWREWWEADAQFRLLVLLAIGSLPAGLAGLFLRGFFAGLFDQPRLAGFMLLLTGAFLWAASRYARGRRPLAGMTVGDALVVGVAQSLAILPGLSRSGTTIAAGWLWGVDREAAARFSFLLAVPAIAGATLLELRDLLVQPSQVPGGILLLGTVAAAIAGYLAIRQLLAFVRAGRLHVFAYYAWLAGLLTLLFVPAA